MKKNTNIKTNHGFIILIAFILLFGAVVYLIADKNKSYSPQTNSIANTEEKTKIFRSSNVMKFSITVPASYKVEEKFASVTITAPQGNIQISKNGTNYDNIEQYIENLTEINKLSITDIKSLYINDIQGISGIIEHPLSGLPSEKAYFLYPESWTVFSLSTSSPALFPVLDQIASSFRYTP